MEAIYFSFSTNQKQLYKSYLFIRSKIWCFINLYVYDTCMFTKEAKNRETILVDGIIKQEW